MFTITFKRLTGSGRFRARAAFVLVSLATMTFYMTSAPANASGIAINGAYALSKENVKTLFSVKVITGSKITGSFGSVSGRLILNSKRPEKSSIKVSVDLSTVTTDNPKVTDFLKSEGMFNVAQFPIAEFTSTAVTRLSETTAQVEGVLTMKGKKQRTSLMVQLKDQKPNGTFTFTADGFFSRALFDMSVGEPIYADRVVLEITGVAIPG
ncbi:MAG: YceI family protein [Rhodobacteraceae bacterium]|nr:YceI family protein [Paracoccaceae bacterium]